MEQISYFFNKSTPDKKITPRNENFPQWYLDIIEAADLAEHGPSKGSMIIKPYGYDIWQRIQAELDSRIKAAGVPNMYFPIFIPQSFISREEKHVEGFAPEVAVVTHAGGKKLEEPLVVRPTSETIIYDSFSRWIDSYRDLPLMINQWANVVRWEMRPRLFLRSSEFLWQEGHTAHATKKEANDYARKMLDMYLDVAQNIMAIQPIAGEKSEKERFAGADNTYTIEAMMQDGKALQFATSHNLGENFSNAFDVKYSAEDGTVKNTSQTSWGMTTRTIGGIIMSHSDDKGLVLPPKLAPIQVVIMPISDEEKVHTQVKSIVKELNNSVRVFVDTRDSRIGEKHYAWEKRGVPIRIEIGPRDVESSEVVIIRRDKSEKENVKIADLVRFISDNLADMQDALFRASKERIENNTVTAKDEEEAVAAVEKGKFVKVDFEITNEKEVELKQKYGITVRCRSFDGNAWIIAKAY